MKEEISLGELIIGLLRFFKKYFIWIAISVVFGFFIGYLNESNKPAKYVSETIICSDIVDAKRLKEIISDFENEVESRNMKYLSEIFGIPLDSAEKITRISVKIIESEKNYRSDLNLTYSKLNQCISVEAEITTPSMYGNIQHAIQSILENHSEIKQIVDQRKQGYQFTKESINLDILFLKEQRVKMYEHLTSNSGRIDINQFDSEAEFIQSYEKLNELDELIIRTKAFNLIKPFNKNVLSKKSKIKGIASSIFLCSFVMIVVLLYREIKV